MFLFTSESLDVWQPHSSTGTHDSELGIQWLDITTTPLLLEPSVILDNNVASFDNLPLHLVQVFRY
jgi:hypothetical protein